ncbi:hypothetical protein ELQ90_11440 [Labedella phragmitis]|uniref:DUF4190 domain-containing protein n=1 Tax=Labedella phragmitis TaxID=2498849 RepID=A0A444PRV7_9MICO|nr:hypothetical protein [Labedella phragmitis]RWZ49952.1 hypothetical protein ELQ90_11440 [Labedella phragmitis]
MTDPRYQEPASQPFAAPSNPGFAPPPAGGQPAGHPAGPQFAAPPAGQPWPVAGSVPFTPHRRSATRSAVAGLVLSILGALIGLAIGWGFPLSIIGLVLALRNRREPGASRTISTWSIVLAAVSGLASVGWLAYSLVHILA